MAFHTSLWLCLGLFSPVWPYTWLCLVLLALSGFDWPWVSCMALASSARLCVDHFIPLLDPPGSVWPGLALLSSVVYILLSFTLKSCRTRGGGGTSDVPIGRGVFQAHSDWLAEREQGIPQGSLCLCLSLKAQTVQPSLAAPGSPPVGRRPGLNPKPWSVAERQQCSCCFQDHKSPWILPVCCYMVWGCNIGGTCNI